MGQARARPGLGLSSTPGRAARARVLQARPIYRVSQASGSSLRSQSRAQLELGIWRLDPSLRKIVRNWRVPSCGLVTNCSKLVVKR